MHLDNHLHTMYVRGIELDVFRDDKDYIKLICFLTLFSAVCRRISWKKIKLPLHDKSMIMYRTVIIFKVIARMDTNILYTIFTLLDSHDTKGALLDKRE